MCRNSCVSSGSRSCLDVLDLERRLDGLAAQLLRSATASDMVMSTVALVAGLGALICSPKLLGHAVLEGQLVVDAKRDFLDRADDRVADARRHVDDDVVADLGRCLPSLGTSWP